MVTPAKLWYLQRAHAERYAKSEAPELQLMVNAIEERLKADDAAGASLNKVLQGRDLRGYVDAIVKADARNYTNASEFVERNKFFFTRPSKEDLLDNRPPSSVHLAPKSVLKTISLSDLNSDLDPIYKLPATEWTPANIRQTVNDVISSKAAKTMKPITCKEDLELTTKDVQKSLSKAVHHYIRWAITAGKPGPDGAESMVILGHEETLQRLRDAFNCQPK